MGAVADPEAEQEALTVRLPATAASISEFRGCLRAWMSDLGVSGEDILDLQLACSEALTMVIEQAPTPVALVVDVEGRLEGGTVTLRIREYGLCRAEHPEPHGHQLLGMTLIRALVDVFEIEAHGDGRTIVLARRVRRAAA